MAKALKFIHIDCTADNLHVWFFSILGTPNAEIILKAVFQYETRQRSGSFISGNINIVLFSKKFGQNGFIKLDISKLMANIVFSFQILDRKSRKTDDGARKELKICLYSKVTVFYVFEHGQNKLGFDV